MTQDNDQRDRIVLAALESSQRLGWTMAALRWGAHKSEGSSALADILFPHGAAEAAAHLSDWADRSTLHSHVFSSCEWQNMSIRNRLTTLITTRLSLLRHHKSAIRRATICLALPTHPIYFWQSLYQTVHIFWQAAGDRSTDINFYSKRMILASVYGTTFLVWLHDNSQDDQDTFAFLERRMNNAIIFGSQAGRIAHFIRRPIMALRSRLHPYEQSDQSTQP